MSAFCCSTDIRAVAGRWIHGSLELSYQAPEQLKGKEVQCGDQGSAGENHSVSVAGEVLQTEHLLNPVWAPNQCGRIVDTGKTQSKSHSPQAETSISEYTFVFRFLKDCILD